MWPSREAAVAAAATTATTAAATAAAAAAATTTNITTTNTTLLLLQAKLLTLHVPDEHTVSEFGMVELRAFGKFSLKLRDPKLFVGYDADRARRQLETT